MDLYVSDLDGTLLNDKAQISNITKNILNKAINNNVNFSIATARTPATIVDILKDINITLPVISMNGSAIYDIKNNKYISYITLQESIVKDLLLLFNKYDLTPFIYTIKDNKLFSYYKRLSNSYQIDFFNNRKKSKLKTFINDDIEDCSNVLYFTLIDNKRKVEQLYDKIKHLDNIYIVKYKDVYNPNVYNLEIYDINATKANAINKLKDSLHFENLIVFGDNLNDLPMFKISDECYAVKNAVNELKEISTSVISYNTDDAVAKFIESRIK